MIKYEARQLIGKVKEDIIMNNKMKKIYCQEDFTLMGAYEIDYLMIVMTVTMLCEQFSLSI